MTTLTAPQTSSLSTERQTLNPVLVYLSSLRSPHSQRMMRRALQRALEALGAGDIDAVETGALWANLIRPAGGSYDVSRLSVLRGRLATTYKPATANQSIVAVRQVLRECWRAGLISPEAYTLAADVLTSVQDSNAGRNPTGRDIEPGEARAVFQACRRAGDKDRPATLVARDLALFSLFYAGLRRAEVAGARIQDWDDNSGQLTVTGKRRKVRIVPFDRAGANAIRAWIALRGNEPGALLLPVRKNGEIVYRRDQRGELLGMTPQAVYMTNKRRAAAAGIDNLTPHDWRRTATGDYLDNGTDPVTVCEIMGWSDPKLAIRYDRRGERARLEAASRRQTPIGR
jgi:integrase